MDDVLEFIKNLDINNKNVVVACSGGPDSMFLLDILIKIKGKLNINIVVAHVHHNLRKESDNEAVELEKFCELNSVTFEMMKIKEYPNNRFSEESARKIRYEFFDKIVVKYNTDILFTAHHGDDLTETILMRITRGSSLKGYAGFERISNDRGYKIVRPLIFLTKEEILEYLDKNNTWYAIDMSNKSDKYTRNRYRKYILPELKKENSKVHLKFAEFNERLLLADNYLKKIIDNIYSDIVSKEEIFIDKFNELDDIVKIYLLEKYLKYKYQDNITSINNKHISIIISMIKNNSNCRFDLPYNKKGIIQYNKFKIIEPQEKSKYEYIFTDSIKLPNGKIIEVDNNTDLTSNYVIHLNSSEIKLPFIVRTRKNGDKMYVKNMLGSKKINDIFTDSKVPKELRDSYPIVTDSTGEIIWIPGIKKSHLDRKKEEKYDIILKYN